ncbi:MAG: YicC/YloC family endoribonuclease [Planctomycetota bacterium]
MPRSMTGYGAAQATGTRMSVEVEIRTVNARSLKLNFRTPSFLAAREPEMEKLVRGRLRRGTVTCYVRTQLLAAEDVIRVRSEVVAGYEQAMAALRKQGLVEGHLSPDGIAQLPGAIETGASKPLRPADWKVVKDAVVGALDALDAMREREAKHLVKDLLAITKAMRAEIKNVEKRVPVVLEEQAAKLKERIDALLADHGVELDEATLAREMALVADRSDVREEITRLRAHLDEFDALLANGGEMGRTLDFLAQEMLREANTMGSKSQDTQLARAVIALKSSVDRLKEQAANLE